MIPSGLFDPLMNACDGALSRVLARGESGAQLFGPSTARIDSAAMSSERRGTANELLAADAFVTWAFEAAADAPETISDRANAAMRRVSDRAVAYLNQSVVP